MYKVSQYCSAYHLSVCEDPHSSLVSEDDSTRSLEPICDEIEGQQTVVAIRNSNREIAVQNRGCRREENRAARSTVNSRSKEGGEHSGFVPAGTQWAVVGARSRYHSVAILI